MEVDEVRKLASPSLFKDVKTPLCDFSMDSCSAGRIFGSLGPLAQQIHLIFHLRRTWARVSDANLPKWGSDVQR